MKQSSYLFILTNILSFFLISTGYNTGFWYGNATPPAINYDSVTYANMTVKINRPIDEGPGQNLIWDPYKTREMNNLYVGNTINRQTFTTQFILDIVYALGINANRVYVTNILKGEVHYSWESNNVIVSFMMLERTDTTSVTLLEAISQLTMHIQDPLSRIYSGTNVTLDIDPLWGLEVTNWDVSLKLSYAIKTVGDIAVSNEDYIDLGGLSTCDRAGAANFSYYCEFERFFEDDISNCLNISSYRVQVLFVKAAAVDAVYVYFRIMPSRNDVTEYDVSTAVAILLTQVSDQSSALYRGTYVLVAIFCLLGLGLELGSGISA